MELILLTLFILGIALLIGLFLIKLKIFSVHSAYLISGFIAGGIFGIMYATSMKFPNLIFSFLYFGMITCLMSIGLFYFVYLIKNLKKSKKLYLYLGLFIGSVISLYLIFLNNFKGFYYFIDSSTNMNLPFILIFNFVVIILFGLASNLIYLFFYNVLKNSQK